MEKYRFPKAHFIGQDDILAVAPVIGKKVDPTNLEFPQSASLNIRRLFCKSIELASGVRVRLVFIGCQRFRCAVEVSINLLLSDLTDQICALPCAGIVVESTP